MCLLLRAQKEVTESGASGASFIPSETAGENLKRRGREHMMERFRNQQNQFSKSGEAGKLDSTVADLLRRFPNDASRTATLDTEIH